MFLVKIIFCLLFAKVFSFSVQATNKNKTNCNEPEELSYDLFKLLSTQLEVLRVGIENMRLKMEVLDYQNNDIKETLLKKISKMPHTTNLQKSIDTENMKLSQLLISSKDFETKNLLYDKNLNCVNNCEPVPEIPESCTAATASNFLNDGVYLLTLHSSSELRPFYAYCLHREDVAWTIIQRREDGSENFYRDWLDYKLGFGDLYGEYWIGLERLHAMTTNHKYELWIFMIDYEGKEKNATYGVFSVSSEEEGFRLTLGNYKGNAGDALAYHADMKFSTYDRDNDVVKKNCAQSRKGGWWYKGCYHSNLNGPYFSYADRSRRYGINWNDWHGLDESLQYTHMAIKPF